MIVNNHFETAPSACRKTFSTRWETVEKVRKTSNSRLSAYIGTVRRELRSKSKSLHIIFLNREKVLEIALLIRITNIKLHGIVF